MAEFIFRDMVKKAGLSGNLLCESAATSPEEDGNPVYPPARKKLLELGIDCAGKRARPLTKADYGRYDLFVGMESRHVAQMRRIFGGDPEQKICRLLDHALKPRDIADPWYSGNFDLACAEIQEGCALLLKEMQKDLP